MPNEKADAEVLSRAVLPAGRIIFHANETGLSAYLINKGTVEIYKHENGADVTIALLHPGEVFGEMALFNDGRRSANARAHTTCELTAIQSNHIERLMARAEPGLKGIIRVLIRRISDINERIEVCPQTGRFRIKGDAEQQPS